VSLRIIGGVLRGRRLEAPPGLDTRPLPDRIKQSLFDWLGQDLSGLTVIDICAGSGSFGIEAFSRGATAVHLIEPGRHAVDTLMANLRTIGNPTAVTWHRQPFQIVLPRLAGADLIFADPPFPWYADSPDDLRTLLELACASLAPDGSILIRGERGQALPLLPVGLAEHERRTYGRSWVAELGATRERDGGAEGRGAVG
jgi:16S rRNA (guanine(966)-N(2))-methyltransferase RsmD